MARTIYEYPAFIHSFRYAKYGKTNHGYYGLEAAGMHDAVADSLRFVAGSPDPKGRRRYLMASFATSEWHEDMDPRFPEQVWRHWRWTGDVDGHWPAFKSAAETAYLKSDPKSARFNSGSITHCVRDLTMETEPLFLAAVVDGLFGVQPWFGENRLFPAMPLDGHCAYHSPRARGAFLVSSEMRDGKVP